jgi:hypothetical protein
MENLFRALPRDLQWEVLTEFVGTHVVRRGKLMRKIVLNGLSVPLRQRNPLPTMFSMQEDGEERPRFIRLYSEDKVLRFFRDQFTDETVYLYRKHMNHMTLYEVKYLAACF